MKEETGRCPTTQWAVDGLTASGACDVEENEEVALAYKYYPAPRKSFALEGVADAEAGSWSVMVDGVAAPFTRVATVVTLATAPAPTAKVNVTFVPAEAGSTLWARE